jgi:hypothetical protein
MFPFVFGGRKIAQGRVAACGIVEAFDELKDGHPRLAVRSEGTSIDQFAFEGGEETLAHRIVVGVADRACRWTNAGLLAAIAESDRGVLGGFKRSSQRGHWFYANQRSSASAGVIQPRVFRGRALRVAAIAARVSTLCTLRSVPFGKYWRSKPLVFSLAPRCQGL